jgi:hypothetical protein
MNPSWGHYTIGYAGYYNDVYQNFQIFLWLLVVDWKSVRYFAQWNNIRKRLPVYCWEEKSGLLLFLQLIILSLFIIVACQSYWGDMTLCGLCFSFLICRYVQWNLVEGEEVVDTASLAATKHYNPIQKGILWVCIQTRELGTGAWKFCLSFEVLVSNAWVLWEEVFIHCMFRLNL